MATAITNNKQPTSIVFIKLVPSGRNESRILEAAYEIYNTLSRERTAKSFVFYHPKEHAVHEDTFSDYHTAPTESDARSLLQLCQDKEIGKYKIQDFCTAFSDDLAKCFTNTSRHLTFVGDHIWQTRSLLYPFMFSYNAWIKRPKRKCVHFVEFRTFMQPFSVLFAQMEAPFELPQWVFRAQQDVHAQVNFFDEIVQVSKRPARPLRILKRGERIEPNGQVIEDGEIKEANEVKQECVGECLVECVPECRSDCGGSMDANCAGQSAKPCEEHGDSVTQINCGCPDTDCPSGDPECYRAGPNPEDDSWMTHVDCEPCEHRRRTPECGPCP